MSANAANDWASIAGNLRTELANETKRRADLTGAGSPPPTTYTFAGRSFDWNGYLNAMLQAIGAAEEKSAAADPFELTMIGRS